MILLTLILCHLVTTQAEALGKKQHFLAFISQLEEETHRKSDILFVLDESGSIRKERFPMESFFVKVIARLIGINSKNNRIAVMSYSSKNDVRFNYIRNPIGNNMCTLMNKDIPAITERYAGKGTYTCTALLHARDILNTGRRNAKR